MDELAPSPSQATAPRWQPISAIDRRIIGVLIEKAKTTPDAYPMSVNSLRSGANQKNNRYPLMELETEDIEESLERLRGLGAVTEVQGGGRVPRYRHHLYDWLGVDKLELSVMAELLLRGAQTEGELRGRAARMDPIPDLAALRTMLTSLGSKGLIVSLTPAGRGHVITHALYEPRELEKLRAEFRASAAAGGGSGEPAPSSRPSSPAEPRDPASGMPRPIVPPSQATRPTATVGEHPGTAPAEQHASGELRELRSEVEQLRDELARLRRDVDEILTQLR